EIGTCLGPCAAACSRRDYHDGVRAARKFLETRDDTPLRKLEAEMVTAAARQAFERAAFLRDRVQPLRWLLDKLAQLHKVRTEYSFIYPATGSTGEVIWYAIHGGRTIAVAVPPRTAGDARAAAKMIKAVYGSPGADARTLESYEHIDGMLIVASWFRRFPKERGKVLSPEEALRRCSVIPSSATR